MIRKIISIFMVICGLALTNAQEINKKWIFDSIENEQGESLISVNPETDFLTFENGEFQYELAAKNNLKASGNYLYQNKLLLFYYEQPSDTVRTYKITQLTDSTLIFKEKGAFYSFKSDASAVPTSSANTELSGTTDGMIPSQGFTMNSLLRGMLGMFVLIVISFLLSSNRKAINWKTVGLGLGFQLLIAIGVLRIPFIQSVFEFVGGIFIQVLEFTRAGSTFLFEGLMDVSTYGFIFAFQVLPTILFFSALTSVLFYLGIIQKIVKAMAWILTKVLHISGMESLSVAGNIFLGQTEAPLLIKAYLEKMNRSEILLVMIGGMATVAGAVLAAYIGFLGGDDPVLQLTFAKHLLAASVMAAPGAIVISKMLYPQTEPINNDIKVSQEKIGSNILDAIANGTTEGLRLAVNVGAMLLVFVAFIAMINGILGGIAGFDGIVIEKWDINWHFTSLNEIIAANTPYDGLSLEFILGYVFAPLMWLIGVATEDMALMGQLLGIKLAASEFIGYIQLAELKNLGNAIHLNYNKSVIMATYMLCGFANFASIGIQIGGIGSLAPGQRKTLSEFGIKAMIGGTIASLLSATIAGMIIG
ncbi:NupC/NupG family nucleoside CNT transporter [Spongiivirga citrea]|uniref:Na+ dependent nucleoside transporter n=1 Tax=Spongiivirga citrea TaxID=1481457 RepID=A0A6M0CLM9_9FLAO|nr:nucleoside transporter C-terminal domain-containing protein [Spongiivirga citrea]NER18845.1 Na+ dependent nucleoside transporter [Spongiivirga citrea]